MGQCFGISSSDDKKYDLPILSRTLSQSTNLTGNSDTTEQNTLSKSLVKRQVHTNKRSHLAYFHDNPLLKPLTANKLYKLRKPNAVVEQIIVKPLVAHAVFGSKSLSQSTQLIKKPNSIKINNVEYHDKMSNRNGRLGHKKRSNSFNVNC